MAFNIGDAVRVRAGVKSPDDDSLSIAGWQGRLFDIDEDGKIVGVRWDSVTLDNLSPAFIRQSEIEGLDWAEMYLGVDEIELAPPRDGEVEAEREREALRSKYRWFDGSDEGERIAAVIADAGEGGDLDAWVDHLSRTLRFPFDAKVTERLDPGPLEEGDRVSVQGLDEPDDSCGVLVNVTHGEEHRVFPLCDLSVLDRKSPCHLPVEDYRVWFANR
jgi:hypothetical protein